MMVNEAAHPLGPHQQQSWQRTIPDQMPWMSACQLNSGIVHFGADDNLNHPPVTETVPGPYSSHSSNLSWASSNLPDLSSHSAAFIAPHQPPHASTLVPDTLASNVSVDPNVLIAGDPVTVLPSIGPSTITASTQQQIPFSNLDQESILTYLPTEITSPTKSEPKSKRTSMEMSEDEPENGPPSKQWLSENVMLRQFDSLNLCAQGSSSSSSSSDNDNDVDADEDGDILIDDKVDSRPVGGYSEKTDLDRYVYLLFHDKNKSYRRQFIGSSAVDSLARNEMDRIHKAIVPWSPSPFPRSDSPTVEESDESVCVSPKSNNIYKFGNDGEPSVTITEVYDDDMFGDDDDIIAEQPVTGDDADLMMD